jgi:hypothetical protein
MKSSDVSRWQRLADRADEAFPEAWIPEAEGDEIIGTFVRLTQGTAKDGRTAPVVVLDTQDGPRSVWLWGTAQLNQFRKARPQPGEAVLHRYLGKVQGADTTRSPYKNFLTIVDRPDQGPDWDNVGDDGQPVFPDPAGPDLPADPVDRPEPGANDDDGDLPFG